MMKTATLAQMLRKAQYMGFAVYFALFVLCLQGFHTCHRSNEPEGGCTHRRCGDGACPTGKDAPHAGMSDIPRGGDGHPYGCPACLFKNMGKSPTPSAISLCFFSLFRTGLASYELEIPPLSLLEQLPAPRAPPSA